MKHEIQSGANFITHLLRLDKKKSISEPQLKKFRDSLIDCFRRRYRDHWYPEKPNKGSGYRTIRRNPKIDPLIIQAGEMSKLSEKTLLKKLPTFLTVWINPQDVCYRFGEDGCICVLYDKDDTEPWTHKTLINTEYPKNKIKIKIKKQINIENAKLIPSLAKSILRNRFLGFLNGGRSTNTSSEQLNSKPMEYKLKTKRSTSMEQLMAYVS